LYNPVWLASSAGLFVPQQEVRLNVWVCLSTLKVPSTHRPRAVESESDFDATRDAKARKQRASAHSRPQDGRFQTPIFASHARGRRFDPCFAQVSTNSRHVGDRGFSFCQFANLGTASCHLVHPIQISHCSLVERCLATQTSPAPAIRILR
jgi:hypothetical protein